MSPTSSRSPERAWILIRCAGRLERGRETPASCTLLLVKPSKKQHLRTVMADVRHNIRGRMLERNFAYDLGLKRKDDAQLTASERERVVEQRIASNRLEPMRGLCVTAGGKLGLVPVTTRPGDMICTFLGGQTMYILRKQVGGEGTGQAYQYVGEAYVHGLMDGEVMEWVQRGAAKAIEFALI